MLKQLSNFFRVGRARYLAGYDLNGNAFYEFPSRSGSTDPRHTRRVIDWKEKLEPSEYDQSSIPAQWVAWLRHTRRQAPSLEELQADAQRIARVRVNAQLIAENHAAWQRSLQAPTEESAPADARLVDTVSPDQTAANSPAEPQPKAGSSRLEQSAAPPKASTSGRRRASAAVPTSEVQSELVDGDRVRRGFNLASRSATQPKATQSSAPALFDLPVTPNVCRSNNLQSNMRFAAIASVIATASLVAAVPVHEGQTLHIQLPFGYKTFDVAIPTWFTDDSRAQDICPDLTVYCETKDGESVGDLGKKPFEWHKVSCRQKDQTKNDAECNLRFADKCLTQCVAKGPLGGRQ
ncbi:hypothetical protein OC861_003746 [Tilletia horrida]|nr:hypothetical protein OC861_003746 [Tilletia horrida]